MSRSLLGAREHQITHVDIELNGKIKLRLLKST